MTNQVKKTAPSKPFWIRGAAACLLVTLLTLDVAQTGWTMPTVSPGAVLQIPSALGTVQVVHRGTNGKMLFYIEDAHSSREAQESIARILGQLVKKNEVKTVFEEGYEGPVPTEWFRDVFPDEAQRKKAAWYLLDRLRLGGAEYAHIVRKVARDPSPVTRKGDLSLPARQAFKLIGVDDDTLRRKNIHLYRKAVAASAQITGDLKALKSELDRMVLSGFPEAFKAWMGLNEKFRAGHLDLAQYLARSEQVLIAAGQVVSQKSFPQISRWLSAVRTQEIPDVNARELYQELESLEKWMAQNFLNPEDQLVWNYLQKLRLLEEINALSLSSSEFETLVTAMPDLGASAGALTREMGEFITSKTKQPLVLSCLWESGLESAREFYRTVEARDRVLNQKLADFSAQKEEMSAALVFGGFHKRAILQMLEAQGWSYAVIEPRIRGNSPRHENYYREIMTAGRLPGEKVTLPDQWVTQERLFNLAQSPQALRRYLAQNLPREFKASLGLKKRPVSAALSEVRAAASEETQASDPWREFQGLSEKKARFRSLLYKSHEVPTGILYPLARTARLLKKEFERLRGSQPDFNAQTFSQTLEQTIAQMAVEEKQLVKKIERQYEKYGAYQALGLAAGSFLSFILWGGTILTLALLVASLAMSISFPVIRNYKIGLAPLPRFMLPSLTPENTVAAELEILQTLQQELLRQEGFLRSFSTANLLSHLRGLDWMDARMHGLGLETDLLNFEPAQANQLLALSIDLHNSRQRVQRELPKGLRRTVMLTGALGAVYLRQNFGQDLPALIYWTGLFSGAMLLNLLFDLYETRLIRQAPLPEVIQKIIDPLRRSGAAPLPFQNSRNLSHHLMQGIETMSPQELVRNIYRMAEHPELDVDYASFLFDVTNDTSARAYIGYGPHGALILPSEFPVTTAHWGRWQTQNVRVIRAAHALDVWIFKVLSGLKLSPKTARRWQRRFSFLRVEMPVNESGQEARRLFFRGHIKITSSPAAGAEKFAVRLAIKPPYAYDEQYASLIDLGLVTKLEFEAGFYHDLLQSVRFLLAGGFQKEAPFSLEEFSHLPLTQAFLKKYLKTAEDGQSLETTLEEFIQVMPPQLAELPPEPDGDTAEGARSEVRGSPKEEDAAVEEAAGFLKQKNWQLPGDTMLYAAPGVDGKTVMAFLRARREITKVILVDKSYAPSDSEGFVRVEMIRNLKKHGASFSNAEVERINAGDFDRITRTISSHFFIEPPWWQFWEEYRVVQIELVARDYLDWKPNREEGPREGFALTVVRAPGEGSFLSWRDRSGHAFFEKVFSETAPLGLIYEGRSFLPEASHMEAHRLELLNAGEEGRWLWLGQSVEEHPQMPADSYWLLRKNDFGSASAFLNLLDKLDYEAVNTDRWKPYLQDVSHALKDGGRSFLHRFHSYYWLGEFFLAGILAFADLAHALFHLAVASSPLISKKTRLGLYRVIAERRFQQDVHEFHQRNSAAVKHRLFRWLLSRLTDENRAVRSAVMQAVLAAGLESRTIMEGLWLLRDELAAFAEPEILELLDRAQHEDPAAMREALYQYYSRRPAALEPVRRSEVRADDKTAPFAAGDQAEAVVDEAYRITFPVKVVQEWMTGKTEFYIRSFPNQHILRLHLNRENWETTALQEVSAKGSAADRRRLLLFMFTNAFPVSLMGQGRLTLEEPLRQKAPFITPGQVTLVRVDENTLDIKFPETAKSEVRKRPWNTEKPFFLRPGPEWLYNRALDLLATTGGLTLFALGASVWFWLNEARAAAEAWFWQSVLWISLGVAGASALVLLAQLVDQILERVERVNDWFEARQKEGRFALAAEPSYAYLFAPTGGFFLGSFAAVAAGMSRLQNGADWQAALVTVGARGIFFFIVGAFLGSLWRSVDFFSRLTWSYFKTASEESAAESIEFLPFSRQTGKNGWVTLSSTLRKKSFQVRYKLEPGGYLRVAAGRQEVKKPYELPSAGDTPGTVVVGLGIQWQPLTGQDENWVIKFDWNPSVQELTPVRVMAIKHPLKKVPLSNGLAAIQYFPWDADSTDQNLLRSYEAGENFPQDFSDFIHWWKQKRFAQGPLAGLKNELLGIQFIQLDFENGESLQFGAVDENKVMLNWIFPKRNGKNSGILSLEWSRAGHFSLELYEDSELPQLQWSTFFTKIPEATRLLKSVRFEHGHLDFLFLTPDANVRHLFPPAIHQFLEQRGLTLDSRIRFQGLLKRSEARAYLYDASRNLGLVQQGRDRIQQIQGAGDWVKRHLGQPLPDVLAAQGIKTEEYTALIYPASGGRDAQLLTRLRKNVFSKLSSFHLDDPSYHDRFSVYDSLAGRKVSAGERMAAQMKIDFYKLGEESLRVRLYDTDYEDTSFDLNADTGKRIWLDKGPGRDAKMRHNPEFYLSTLRRALVRPGDLVLAVPYAGAPHDQYWHKQIAKQVYIPDYDEHTNWDAFLVTEEDFTAAGLPVPARSEQRASKPADRQTYLSVLRNLTGRYTVAVDAAVFTALAPAEREEFYELFEAYQAGGQVKFIFNAAAPEDRMALPSELRVLDQRYTNVQVVSMPAGKLSFNDEGRRVITVSRKGMKAVFSRFVENQTSPRNLLKVRYGFGKTKGGLLAAALLLYETQEPETWKLAAGGFLTEIPGMFSTAISDFLAGYIAVGISA